MQFAFYQYGSEAAIPAYMAVVHIDDLAVREMPLVEVPTGPIEQMVDAFEYTDADALREVWTGSGGAVLDLSRAVSGRASGATALEATFNFPSMEWATEILTAAQLATPISIASTQYISFRIKGDPAFSASDFRNGYLYVYDSAGNFGRWGTETPTTADWKIVNHLASTIEQPWNSPAKPDLGNIVQFAWYQYGSQTVLPAYTAKVAIDELQIRHTPLVDAPLSPDRIVEAFEYTEEQFPTSWTGSANVVLSQSEDVSHKAVGAKSLKLEFNFPSTAWATEIARGPLLDTPVTILPGQYITLRVKGDPAFTPSDFRNFYLYVYDADGNFGRWGAPIPLTDDWKIFNFSANSIEKPWDSAALPKLSEIVRFAFFQYGSETAIDPYSATVYIDEIMVRNAPLNEFPAPSQPRGIIDNFESYADGTALMSAYTYVNSPAATVTTADVVSPGAEGSKALKLRIDFAGGQYPWGSIRANAVAPFSFPANGVLTLKFKGDPAMAATADAATTFWLSFYDGAGRPFHYQVPAEVVSSGEWSNLQAPLSAFTDSSAVDIGNLTSWRILVQGWEGTAESAPLTGTFHVDDIQIVAFEATPSLTATRSGNSVVLSWPGATTGYTLESSATLPGTSWEPVAGVANNQVTVPTTGNRFFRLRK